MENEITFSAILNKLQGPLVDGGFRVSFDISEGDWVKIAPLPMLSNKQLKISITVAPDLEVQ